jgi:hypothetical protein
MFKGTVRPDYISLRVIPLRRSWIGHQLLCIKILFYSIYLSYPLNSGKTVCMESFFLSAVAFYWMKKSAKVVRKAVFLTLLALPILSSNPQNIKCMVRAFFGDQELGDKRHFLLSGSEL